MGEPLYKYDKNGSLCTNPEKEEISSFLQEYQLKESVVQQLYTPYGYRIAQEKIEKTKVFYEGLISEIASYHDTKKTKIDFQ